MNINRDKRKTTTIISKLPQTQRGSVKQSLNSSMVVSSSYRERDLLDKPKETPRSIGKK